MNDDCSKSIRPLEEQAMGRTERTLTEARPLQEQCGEVEDCCVGPDEDSCWS